MGMVEREQGRSWKNRRHFKASFIKRIHFLEGSSTTITPNPELPLVRLYLWEAAADDQFIMLFRIYYQDRNFFQNLSSTEK